MLHDCGHAGCLIIDEVHERDVYSEFLLLYIRNLLVKGMPSGLRLVLMSATINANLFLRYFHPPLPAPLQPVHIDGRMFPVSEYYLEDALEWTGAAPCTVSQCAAVLHTYGTRVHKRSQIQPHETDFAVTWLWET